jgi:hypothetical protein
MKQTTSAVVLTAAVVNLQAPGGASFLEELPGALVH